MHFADAFQQQFGRCLLGNNAAAAQTNGLHEVFLAVVGNHHDDPRGQFALGNRGEDSLAGRGGCGPSEQNHVLTDLLVGGGRTVHHAGNDKVFLRGNQVGEAVAEQTVIFRDEDAD